MATTPDRPQSHPPPSTFGMEQAPAAPGMLRIGRSPALTVLPVLLPVTVVLSLMVGRGVASGTDNSGLSFTIAFVACAALVIGSVMTGMLLYYRPVGFDPATGSARLGRVTAPASNVIAVRRELRSSTRSSYLSYRFSAANGAWGRVLVAGRPMRGLRPDELRLLERFVVATAIPESPAQTGMSHTQRVVADAIGATNASDFRPFASKRPAGKSELLAELRGEPPAAASPQPDPPSTRELRQQWRQDDRDAEFVQLWSTADTVRRVIGCITAGAGLAALVLLAMAAIMENSSGGGLEPDTNDAVTAAILTSIGLALVSYFWYTVAAVVSGRHTQRTVLAWVRGRDADQVVRGIPPRLLAPFLGNPPGHGVYVVGGFAGCVVGGFMLIMSPVSLLVPAPPAVAPVTLVIGIALTWAGILLFRRDRNAARQQHSLAAWLGGQRVTAGWEAEPEALRESVY